MSLAGLTLLDVLSMVPCLLPACLAVCASTSTGIRTLRLVSKEMNTIALTAITSCTVCLGEGAFPAPQQLVKLMSHAQLQQLYIIIKAGEGASYPSMPQQLSTCTAQMDCLLMGNAVNTVLALTVKVKLQSKDKLSAGDLESVIGCNGSGCSDTFRSDLSRLTQEVCSRLAPKLPCLTELHLIGYFRDTALGEFGSNCLQLTGLEISAISVQWKKGIADLVPHLKHIKLIGSEDSRKQGVTPYLETVFFLLRDCNSLENLELILEPDDGYDATDDDIDWVISCSTEAWDGLPDSIFQFACDARIEWPLEGTSFMERMEFLDLAYFTDAGSDLPQILGNSPSLQKLLVMHCDSPADLLWDQQLNNTPSLDELESFKSHLLSGFELGCSSVNLTGPVALVKDILSCISPVQATDMCEIVTHGDVQAGRNLLEQLAVVFPNLQHLTLDSNMDEELIEVDEQYLQPLGAFGSLETLDLSWWTEYTVAGLVGLCLSIPTLRGVHCLPADQDACYAAAMIDLRSRGRQVIITTEEDALFGQDPDVLAGHDAGDNQPQ